MACKAHLNFSRANQEKVLAEQSTNFQHDEINIMNIINDNTFNSIIAFEIMTMGI